MLKLGIVGTGRTVGIAANHAIAINAGNRARIAAVYNRTPESSKAFAASHCPDAFICESYAQLLGQVDAVVLCTPNDAHVGQAAEAIEAGRPVLLEKPMGTELAPCRRLVASARTANVLVMVGYVYRYSPVTTAVKTLMQQSMGKVYTYSASFGGKRLADPRLPLEWRMVKEKAGGGAVVDFGSHLLDLAAHICGISLATLSCHGQRVIPSRPAGFQGKTEVDNDDCAVISGCGCNGEVVSLLMSRVGMDGIQLCISGEGGLVRASYDAGQVLWWPKELEGGYTGQMVEVPVESAPPQGWFKAQMEDFITGVLENKGAAGGLEAALAIEEQLEKARNKMK